MKIFYLWFHLNIKDLNNGEYSVAFLPHRYLLLILPVSKVVKYNTEYTQYLWQDSMYRSPSVAVPTHCASSEGITCYSQEAVMFLWRLSRCHGTSGTQCVQLRTDVQWVNGAYWDGATLVKWPPFLIGLREFIKTGCRTAVVPLYSFHRLFINIQVIYCIYTHSFLRCNIGQPHCQFCLKQRPFKPHPFIPNVIHYVTSVFTLLTHTHTYIYMYLKIYINILPLFYCQGFMCKIL